MNSIAAGLRKQNNLRTLLGEGEPGLHTLLGGAGAALPSFGSGVGAGRRRAAYTAAELRLAGGSASGTSGSSRDLIFDDLGRVGKRTA